MDKLPGQEKVEQIKRALPPRTSWEKESSKYEDEIVRKARKDFLRKLNNPP